MQPRKLISQVLVVVGLMAMLLGAIDPFEGSLVILPGSGLVAMGAMLGKNTQRRLLGVAFVLVAVGVGVLVRLSSIGGVGGNSGHSIWWLLTVVPYPVGWMIGLGGALALVGSGWHRRLLLCGVFLVVMDLGVLILIWALRDLMGRMPSVWYWLLVSIPNGLGLITALTGGVLWIVKSYRVPHHQYDAFRRRRLSQLGRGSVRDF